MQANDVNNIINPRPCTCGRSATGFCVGLHRLTDEQWDAMVFDEVFSDAASLPKDNE